MAKIAPHLKPIGSSLLQIAADAGTGAIKFFIAIVVAGFLFSPAPSLVDASESFHAGSLRSAAKNSSDSPAPPFGAVSRGVIGISALQAFLAGLGLMVAGIPGASLITSAVLILGIIQIGPSIVLIPLIIWSWTAMETTTALLFTAYMIPVNLLDNVLRPLVMGRGLDTPILDHSARRDRRHHFLRHHRPVSGPHRSGGDLGTAGGLDQGERERSVMRGAAATPSASRGAVDPLHPRAPPLGACSADGQESIRIKHLYGQPC